MNLIYLCFFLLILLVGLYLGFLYIKDQEHLVLDKEENIWKVVINAAEAGLSGSILMFSGTNLVESLRVELLRERSYQFSIVNLIKEFVFFLVIPGFFIFIGLLWSHFIVGKYRDWLKKYSARDKKKNQ
jgi:hypothetical protein